MIDRQFLHQALPHALSGLDLPFLGEKVSGKVREIYRTHGRLLLITTDRLSAFDRILGLVPYRGQVLNQLSAFWFERSRDILAGHLLEVPDPNVAVVQPCRPLPVEVIVRGYITGVTETSLWHRYSQGERTIYGMSFPDGLHKNEPLPQPIITPTTKARDGGHDERITGAEIVAQGLVAADVWARISKAAIALFQRGQEIAQQGGLILVDTKYEFGLTADGDLAVIDEIHTPDSSRFWIAETYAARKAAGQEPENFDKEFVRLHYAHHGYRGEGEPMPMPDELAVQAAERYIRVFEMLTGQAFLPAEYPAGPRIERNLRAWLATEKEWERKREQ